MLKKHNEKFRTEKHKKILKDQRKHPLVKELRKFIVSERNIRHGVTTQSFLCRERKALRRWFLIR